MNLPESTQARLQHLARVVIREMAHLDTTNRRLFATPFTIDKAVSLNQDVELAERVDAFVTRFGRLQDTLGDKLLPQLLGALGEPISVAIDNLNRAEKNGFITSTEHWWQARKLRNQMIHEYIEDPEVLASALTAGHDFVPQLIFAADAMLKEMRRRHFIAQSGTH